MTVNEQIIATDAGVTIPIDPQISSTSIITLAGSTCALVVQYQGSPRYGDVLPLQINPDGVSLLRVTTATDFPVGGQYVVQLMVTLPGGRKYRSPLQTITVGQALAA